LTTGTTLHPSFSLKTSSDKYLSISVNAEKLTLGKPQVELRADAEEIGKFEGLRIKCQRDFVNKARAELAGGPKGKKRNTENGRTVDIEGTVDDERERKYAPLSQRNRFLNQADIIALAAQSSRLGISGSQSYRRPIGADSARRRRMVD